MVEVRTTPQFDRWIGRLKHRTVRGLILARINRLHEGLEGDIKPVGKGVSVLRIHFGPGYRVDLRQRGDALDTGNPAHNNRALGDVARAKGMTQLAKETGETREVLYRALSETGIPQFKTVLQAVKAMGLRLSVLPQ